MDHRSLLGLVHPSQSNLLLSTAPNIWLVSICWNLQHLMLGDMKPGKPFKICQIGGFYLRSLGHGPWVNTMYFWWTSNFTNPFLGMGGIDRYPLVLPFLCQQHSMDADLLPVSGIPAGVELQKDTDTSVLMAPPNCYFTACKRYFCEYIHWLTMLIIIMMNAFSAPIQGSWYYHCDWIYSYSC